METIEKDGQIIGKIAVDKEEAFLENVIKGVEDKIRQDELGVEMNKVVLAHLIAKRKAPK